MRQEIAAARGPGELPRSFGRLGLTLRSILLTPRAGFSAALRNMERRRRAARRTPEGLTPYVLSGIGGAALLLLWLKVGGLLGLREVTTTERVSSYLVSAMIAGALISVLAQAVWGLVGTKAVASLGGRGERSGLRLVWGGSQFPQVVAVLLLLPLDLLIVGSETFTTIRLEDPLDNLWIALSTALSVSLLVWTVFLSVRGLEVAGSLKPARAAVATVAAFATLAVVIAAVLGLALVAVRS